MEFIKLKRPQFNVTKHEVNYLKQLCKEYGIDKIKDNTKLDQCIFCSGGGSNLTHDAKYESDEAIFCNNRPYITDLTKIVKDEDKVIDPNAMNSIKKKFESWLLIPYLKKNNISNVKLSCYCLIKCLKLTPFQTAYIKLFKTDEECKKYYNYDNVGYHILAHFIISRFKYHQVVFLNQDKEIVYLFDSNSDKDDNTKLIADCKAFAGMNKNYLIPYTLKDYLDTRYYNGTPLCCECDLEIK